MSEESKCSQPAQHNGVSVLQVAVGPRSLTITREKEVVTQLAATSLKLRIIVIVWGAAACFPQRCPLRWSDYCRQDLCVVDMHKWLRSQRRICKERALPSSSSPTTSEVQGLTCFFFFFFFFLYLCQVADLQVYQSNDMCCDETCAHVDCKKGYKSRGASVHSISEDECCAACLN